MRPVKVLTMLLAGGIGERLYPLTARRSKPAVHFGGNFRIIDFTLMNCVLSGLRQVHVLTQYHSFSLGQHQSRRWNILSAGLGESIELVPPKMRTTNGFYQGTADAIYRNLDLLDKHRPDVVLILSGDHIYRADYERFIRAHIESDADITVLTGSVSTEQARSFGVVRLGKRGRILDFVEKPDDPSPYSINGNVPINLGVYCFQTEFLVERLVKDSKEDTAHDFGKNILPEALKVGALMSCPLGAVSPDDTPYWRDVGTIDSFFRAHMDLLASPPVFDLNDPRWPDGACFQEWMPSIQSVRTHLEGRPVHGKNLISSGVTIEDARIVDSVLFPGTGVGESSELHQVILFPGAKVGPRCRLKKVIVEEGVHVPAGTHIEANEDSHDFVVSDEGIVVVSEGYRFVKPPIEVRRKASTTSPVSKPTSEAPDQARERTATSAPPAAPSETRKKDATRKAVTKKVRRAAAATSRQSSAATSKTPPQPSS